GADEGHLVGVLGDLREDAADIDAGQVGLYGTDDAAVLGWGLHLGVESFHVGRTAAQPEPDDRGVFRGLPSFVCAGPKPEQIRQHEAAETEGADLEEVASGCPLAVAPLSGAEEIEHELLLCCARAPGYEGPLKAGSGRQPVAGSPLKKELHIC